MPSESEIPTRGELLHRRKEIDFAYVEVGRPSTLASRYEFEERLLALVERMLPIVEAASSAGFEPLCDCHGTGRATCPVLQALALLEEMEDGREVADGA